MSGDLPAGSVALWGLIIALAYAVPLLLGYVAGSLPVSARVGRLAGVDVTREGEANPGSANVWKLAGPGWGLLALTGDLAKGLLPVAIAMVTWGWWPAWAAAMGAVLGASWPFLGRLPGGRGVATMAGACVALAPVAGLLCLVLAGVVVLGAKALGRNGRVAAIATAFATFPLLALLELGSPLELAGIGGLYLVAVARYASTRR